jgi:predicted DCC family thiol-disulfide oxidoreductase YuxK
LVEHPPDRPLLVFDGNCPFCRTWVRRWHRVTGDRADYTSFQEVGERFPEISRETFAAAVQLILPHGQVFGGAHAVFRLLALVPGKNLPLWLYEHAPGFRPTSELFYKLIARHRSLGYGVTKFLWGIPLEAETFRYASWLFLRLLGFVYLIAFLSFGVQAAGLIGARGISPLPEFLDAARQYFEIARFWNVPTLFWLQSSDAMLRTVWIAGAAFSVLMVVGVNSRAVRIALFVLYLSLVVAGQEFMGYQWDALLLEAGFLAIFLGSSALIIKLFRWLLFRLMFLSGAVKLLSHDPAWHSFAALPVHYETQPLPTPLAWYFYQLPAWFQHFSVGFVFFVELFVPILILAPRRLRMWAAAMITLLQILIALTGNYAFFNLLTVTLCLFLLDDAFVRRLLPQGIVHRRSQAFPDGSQRIWMRRFCIVVYALILFVSGFEMMGMFSGIHWPPAQKLTAAIAPFEIVNTYGLFAVMTTTRPEIIIEGSSDGETWVAYEFRYKPVDPDRQPPWVAPHQPRLDWQMWFAALGDYRSNRWILQFMARLLEGSPEVLGLLRSNPFPTAPPRYLRAALYQYHFTDPEQRRKTANPWRRELIGEYVPVISLRSQTE